jgi:hypothetical protein
MHGLAIAVLALAILAGCETTGTKPGPPASAAQPAAPVPPPKPAAQVALDEGIAQFDAGDFNKAIQTLQGAKDIWEGGTAAHRVQAYKYIGLAYCVTQRRPQCRQQFVEALKLDPGFALEAAERTHPVWGPEYDAAKRSLAAPPKPAAPAPAAPAKPAPAKPAAS